MKEKRTNKHGYWLAPSAREKFVPLLCSSPCICWLITTSVYSSEIPAEPPGMLTHPFTLANPASEPTGPSSCSLLLTALFCWLLLTIDCLLLFCRLGSSFWLPSSVDCPVLSTTLFLSLPSSGLVGNLARKSFVRVLRQNRQRDTLAGTHRNDCHPSCHN